MRNHTAAHLLQSALRQVLGNHVEQAGQLVNSNRLRFDFSHFSAMTEEELKAVETEVNMAILSCTEVENFEAPIEEAKKLGATALFGEKYGETVRVVKIGNYSIEFCGGTHAKNTGNLGLFKIISESGVAAGVRRIEATTGFGVLGLLENAENTAKETAKALKTSPADIAVKAQSLTDELKEAKREIESLKSKMAQGGIDDILNSAEEVKGIKVIASKMADGLDMNALRTVGDNLKQKTECGVIVLASNDNGKVNIIAMATPSAMEKGAHAGNIVREVAKVCGGGGGGKPDSAQAGGKDASKIEDALNIVKDLI